MNEDLGLMSVRWQNRNPQTLLPTETLTYQQYMAQKAFMRTPETTEDDSVPQERGKPRTVTLKWVRKIVTFHP